MVVYLCSCDSAGKDTADEDSSIESKLSAHYVRADTPKGSSKDKADVICHRAEAGADGGGELVGGSWPGCCETLRPEVVHNPSESVHDEESPLEPVQTR
jgi:hypothetical protein